MVNSETNSYKISVIGAGYVGISLAVLLSQKNDVIVHDIDREKISILNQGKSTIIDKEIDLFQEGNNLGFKATSNLSDACNDADFIIIATPTNFNKDTNKFDTSSVDSVVKIAINANPSCLIVIKSTLPVGHTRSLQALYNTKRIIFSPEFLREGKAIYDNLYPSRIIVGGFCEASNVFANLLLGGARKKDIQSLFVSSTEAESIKLFANTYLAMRVSFFNELDSFALSNKLDSKNLIQGVSLDPRIGDGYNNPSFGYGGYCLPKDTKQLLANFENIPQTLIEAIISSNNTRKEFIVNEILKLNPKVVGIYKLAMKKGSDNFRSSAIKGVMRRLLDKGISLILYEPSLNDSSFLGSTIYNNLDLFKERADLIIANRDDNNINDVRDKVFTRDLFKEN